MEIQNLEVDLDLNQNLNIYATCKQFDSLTLICSIYSNSIQADLSNYYVRLKAMKSDQIPLIQEYVGITISNNVVTVLADEQLTTTSGKTAIELVFINKTTGEKKATFNLVLNVVPTTVNINGTISTATYTLLEELENKLDQISDFIENIDEAIEVNTDLIASTNTANSTKTELDGSNTTALATKTALDTSNTNANTTKTSLNTSITNANNSKTALDTSKTNADASKVALDNSIDEANSFISAHGDIIDLDNRVTQNTASLSDIASEQTIQNTNIGLKADNTDSNRNTTDKTVTGAINELNNTKANKTYVDSQVQANNLTYKESYATLTALQTAYPAGDTYNHCVLADGFIYTWANLTWTNTQIQANGSGISDGTVNIQKISNDLLRVFTPVTLDFTNNSYQYGTLNNIVIADIPIKKEGVVLVKLKSAIASTIRLLFVTKSANIFNVVGYKDYSVVLGEQVIKTDFYSNGTTEYYIGIQNLTSAGCITYGVTQNSIGYYSNSSNVDTSTVSSFTTTTGTSTFSIQPIISAVKSVIDNDIIAINQLDINLKDKISLDNLIIDNLTSYFAGNLNNIIIQDIPLSVDGRIVLNIKSSKITLKILLLEKSDDTFTIKNSVSKSLISGINEIDTGFYSTGEGNQYIGFYQDTTASSVAYGAVTGANYYQTSSTITSPDSGITFTPTLHVNTAFAIKVSVVRLKQKDLPWYNKKANFLGDSVTQGINTTKVYHQYLKENLGFNICRNYGMNGAELTTYMATASVYGAMNNDADIVFVFGGTNDFYRGEPLGEWYTVTNGIRSFNTNNTTFRGALATLCQALQAKYPSKQIVLMTPIHRNYYPSQPSDLEINSAGLYLEDYVNAIKEAGQIFAIEVIDLYNKSGMNPHIAENATLYYHKDTDELHPNAVGHKRIAKVIEGALNYILPKS